ncbi:circadian clock KaiB family protein [Megalodesulfovibrio gigas]|uniref:Putative thioredoxin-like protein n=1 Tax=Megalodesulfovibrio gigas (strain ATCC 19364 / DSM 1382 / NCIMB 9332 / VKM B-1759) TaxID=1121448 RepID=T2GD07_MEGG1|nr:circadian clock KaiB family protein [Megalodesulfovibrio gigas]AGW14178.1 putative thioredoxin-like protein [Megalodesulfovibrio gigas DSM 1382 = ATCC 19364]
MHEAKNWSDDFEKALKAHDQQQYVLRLFVAGMTPRSMEAISSIKDICEGHLKGRYEIDVVDIYEYPELAKEQQVLAVPTLVKLLPLPLRKFIGSLSDEERILKGLDIQPKK